MARSTRLTASIYLRLSSPDEADRTGFPTQEAASRALAERLGAEVSAVHKDDGWSGVLRQRPGFRKWMADGAAGTDLLVAWKSDRISRGGIASIGPLVDLANGIDPDTGLEHRGHRPRVMTAMDSVDSAQAGWEIAFSVHSETARAEREATRVRMLAHRAANRAQGRAVGGRRAWAFQTAPRPGGGRRLEPVPAHAEAIRWALEHLRAGGSLHGVVREWTARGLQPKGSKRSRSTWHVSPVRRILASPNLYGATTHHGALIRNDDGTVRIDAGQAILSLAEWTEMQALLTARTTRRDAPDRYAPALLAGLLHCGSCDRVMYPHRPEGRTWTYRCRGGVGCDRPVSVVMGAADDYLSARFRDLIGDAPERPAGWVPDVAEVDPEEVARLTEALTAVDALLAGDLDDDEALQAVRQRRELRARRAALQDAAEGEPTGLREEPSGRTFAEAYDAAETVRERTRLIGLAFDHVTVSPGVRGGAHAEDVSDRFEI